MQPHWRRNMVLQIFGGPKTIIIIWSFTTNSVVFEYIQASTNTMGVQFFAEKSCSLGQLMMREEIHYYYFLGKNTWKRRFRVGRLHISCYEWSAKNSPGLLLGNKCGRQKVTSIIYHSNERIPQTTLTWRNTWKVYWLIYMKCMKRLIQLNCVQS